MGPRSFVAGVTVAVVAAAAAAACSSFEDGSGASPPPPAEAGVIAEAGADAPVAPPCDQTKLDTDGANCGRCGHSCLGGACEGGACKPVLLGAQPIDVPVLEVAVGDQLVYWSAVSEVSGGSGARGLYACPKAGCQGAPPDDLTGTRYAGAVASDGKDTYTAFVYPGPGNASLFKVLGTTLAALPGSHGHANYLAIRRDGLYFVARDEPAGTPYARTIVHWDGTQERSVGSFSPPVVQGVPVNTTPAAYTKDRAYIGANNVGYIASVPLAGGTFAKFLEGDVALVTSMTATDDRVFWTALQVVRSCANGATCTLAVEELTKADLDGTSPRTVTSTGGQLYIQTDEGDLWSCAPTACRATKKRLVREPHLAVDLSLAGHTVAADADAVYYAAGDAKDGGGWTWRIMKLAK